MNPLDPVHCDRLFRAMRGSFDAKKPFRNLTRELIREFAGSGYGNSERPQFPTWINLMNQAADAYTMALVANRPRVLLSTFNPNQEFFARQFQEAMNNLIEEICLENTLKNWVLDALFCVGIIKTHLADSGQVMLEEGFMMDPGSPAASNVSIDNWCHDMGATRWDQVKFAADMYRLPFEDVQQSDIYDQSATADLTPTSKYPVEDESLAQISRGEATDKDELEPMIDLCDVWVPRDGMIYTFAIQSRDKFEAKGKPLAVMEWDGPEYGPYHLLGFNDVPENIMPTSPFSHISRLSRLINSIMRRQAGRAMRHKRNHIYTAAGAEDAKKIQGGSDDEWVNVQDVNGIGEVETGGVNNDQHAFMLGCMELFDRMAGNLPAMMGLGAQAETASQEQLIHSAVSKKEAQMQYRVFDATRKLMRDLGYMLWNDKFKVIPGKIPIDGADGYAYDAPWSPESREGSFYDYNFNIDVYSMGYQSPAQRLNGLNSLLTQFYMPALPILQQQGMIVDFQAILQTHSELMNEPRIKQWIKSTSMPMDQQGGGQQEMPKPSVTSRTVTRKSVPTGGTHQSRTHVQQQAWLNGSQNSKQSAALSRPAG